jgi:predicted transcriptional regulator
LILNNNGAERLIIVFKHIKDLRMKQRSTFSIVSLILENVAGSEPKGITKTKIMQYVMLNHKRVNRYCYRMVESGLLLYKPEMRTFHITEKGRFVLRNCAELAPYISSIHRLISKYRYGDTYYYPEGLEPADNVNIYPRGNWLRRTESTMT